MRVGPLELCGGGALLVLATATPLNKSETISHEIAQAFHNTTNSFGCVITPFESSELGCAEQAETDRADCDSKVMPVFGEPEWVRQRLIKTMVDYDKRLASCPKTQN